MSSIGPVNALRVAVRLSYDVQQVRIEMENRLREVGKREGYELEKGWEARLKTRMAEFAELEKSSQRDVAELLSNFGGVSEWLLAEKGLGPMMAAVIISEYADPRKAPTVSAMWAFAGLNVRDDGEAPNLKHMTRGVKRPWNAWLRTKLVGVLGASLMRAGSPRREHYEAYKHRQISRALLEGKRLLGEEWHAEATVAYAAVRKEASEREERAVPHEKPVSQKRAAYREKPETHERATSEEKPVPTERAEPTEKPVRGKRAVGWEKPVSSERAVWTEQPEAAERAKAKAKATKRLSDALEKARKKTDGAVWNLGHIHQASIRYMIKLLIADFYPVWRESMGLEVRPPYHEEKLGHKHAV